MNHPSILLVDADVVVRHPLAEYLRECGYNVLEAADAAEARDLLERKSSEIGVVLADANVSEGGNFALAGWVRLAYPAIRMVMAGSVAAAAAKASDLCKDGPALTKPYDHKFVLEHIRRLMAARDRAG